MKKFLILGLVLIPFAVFAEWQADRSSRTIGTANLVRIPNTGPGDELVRVIVSSCSTVGGAAFSVYDSSAQDSGIIARIHLSSSPMGNNNNINFSCIREYPFHIRISSAITYSATSGADVTILWENSSLDREQ